ncbi:MAG: hypothetical protein JSR17_12205 [Proteobacteria bacterium]|nr:hypothetical protein [Pseudomonadota bacterium]
MLDSLNPFLEQLTKIESEVTRMDLAESGRLTSLLVLLAPISIQAKILLIVIKEETPLTINNIASLQERHPGVFLPTKQQALYHEEIVINFISRATAMVDYFLKKAHVKYGDNLVPSFAFELSQHPYALATTRQPAPIIYSLEASKKTPKQISQEDKTANTGDYEGISFMRGVKKGFFNQ